MATPFGKQLQHARLARGLTIDDIQHHTRIPRSLVTAIETDDLSAFANPTYARKFIHAYARHLDVDAGPILHRFHPHGLAGIVQYHPYLHPHAEFINPTHRRQPTPTSHRSAAPLYVGLAALALAICLALYASQRHRTAGTHLTAPVVAPTPAAPTPAAPTAP